MVNSGTAGLCGSGSDVSDEVSVEVVVNLGCAEGDSSSSHQFLAMFGIGL